MPLLPMVILKAGEETYELPRQCVVILSSYFRRKLDTYPEEESVELEVKLEEEELELFAKVVRFIKTSELSPENDQLPRYLRMSQKFEIPLLTHRCVEIIVRVMDSSNVLGFYDVVHESACPERLQAKCLEYIAENVNELPSFSGFGQMCGSALANIFSSPQLDSVYEDNIFDVFLQWLEIRKPSTSDIYTVLKVFNLSIIPAKMLYSVQKYIDEGSEQAEECSQEVETALWSKLLPNEQKFQKSSKSSRHCSARTCEVAVVSDLRENVRLYDITHNLWVDPIQLPTLAEGCAIGCHGGELYTAGGSVNILQHFTLTTSTNKFWRYDFGERTWHAMPPMQKNRTNFILTDLDGELYAIGGLFQNIGPAEFRIEKFSFVTNEWTSCTALPYDEIPALNVIRLKYAYLHCNTEKKV